MRQAPGPGPVPGTAPTRGSSSAGACLLPAGARGKGDKRDKRDALAPEHTTRLREPGTTLLRSKRQLGSCSQGL